MIPSIIIELIKQVEPLLGKRVLFTNHKWSGTEATLLGIDRISKNEIDDFYLATDVGRFNLLYLNDFGLKIIGVPERADSKAVTFEVFLAQNKKMIDFLSNMIFQFEKKYWMRYSPATLPNEVTENKSKLIYYSPKKAKKPNNVPLTDLTPKELEALEKEAKLLFGSVWDDITKKTKNEILVKSAALLGKDAKAPSRALIWQASENAMSLFDEFSVRLARLKGIPVINLEKPNWQNIFSGVFPGVFIDE